MAQTDDEQTTTVTLSTDVLNCNDTQLSQQASDYLVEAVNKMGEAIAKATLPIGATNRFHYHASHFNSDEMYIQIRRSWAVQEILDKHKTLYAHWQRGLIATDEIGDLLDACQLELVAQIEAEDKEREEQESVLWRMRYDFGAKNDYLPFVSTLP